MGTADPTPRLEYRVWAPPAPVTEAIRARGRHTGRSQVRDCYVLAHDPEVNAKIRERRLEVKRLLERRAGFERWTPAWSSEAPFAPTVVTRLYAAFGMPPGQAIDAPLSVEGLVGVLRRDGHLDAAWVTKRRAFFEIEGLPVEITELHVERSDDTMTTAAIEGVELDDLERIGRELGLTDLENIPVDRAVLAAVEGADRAD